MKVRHSVEQLLPLLVPQPKSRSRSDSDRSVQTFGGVQYWSLAGGLDGMAILPKRYSRALTRHHALVFFLTFFAFVFIHAARKTFSNVRTALTETWTLLPLNETIFPNDTMYLTEDPFLDTIGEAEVFFSVLDTVFLASYTVGLFISGFIGDRLDLRLVLSFGMCSSAMMMFLFGTLSEWVKVYNHWYYAIFWILNGLLQGTGWPTLIAVMGNWFSEKSRGLVFGIWSACGSVGNIVGALSASLVLTYGYEFAFLLTAIMMFFWGLVILFFLNPSPRDAGLYLDEDDDDDDDDDEREQESTSDDKTPFANKEKLGSKKEKPSASNKRVSDDDDDADVIEELRPRPKPIGFLQAFLLPGVACYSLGFACVKLVSYSLFSWLPYYLTSNFQWTEVTADRASMAFDFGGIIGGSIGGLISDFLGIRSPVVIFMLFGSMGSLYGYSVAPANNWNALVMAIAGAFVCGVTHMIGSTIAADLGQRKDSLGQDKEALSTVTGIIDGTGTFGAAIGQVVIPMLKINYGWGSVFAFFVVMIGSAVFFISPIFIKEMRSKCQSRST
ncbi:sugar phosphate exchanger 3 [Strongylocentrotus purpuratus]|uniref:Sugar phosphate exchanger 3 n=1 Tax=Strongylocentrotus purpuratus TaxID=7668 RepID=A0A7M7N0K5_STRPU|nr:sugar phosphate exchanger 3 [Strongylocentrotus purpuratus]